MKSGGGPPQSKTWRKFGAVQRTRSVLECASRLALWNVAIANSNVQGKVANEFAAPGWSSIVMPKQFVVD